MTKKDDPPESQNPPAEPPADPPANPPTEPPAEPPASDGVPEWGKTLQGQVEGLTQAVTDLAEHHNKQDDVSPVRTPWHKRGGK